MVEIIDIRNGIIPELDRSIACIGYFDGFHKGHQKLIERTVDEAKEHGLIPMLICFSPDPITVISSRPADHLFPDEIRYELAQHFGIRKIAVIEFTRGFMDLGPEDFIRDYLNRMDLHKLVCGFDFSYGKMGKGNDVLLKQIGDFETIVIEEESYQGSKISSSRIKELISSGDMKLAERLLGFSYRFIVEVKECSENGSEWLICAKLMDERCVMPKNGRYGSFEVCNDKFYLRSERSYQEGEIIYLDEEGIHERFI